MPEVLQGMYRGKSYCGWRENMLVKPRGNDQVQCISEENAGISIEIMDRKHGIVVYCGSIRVVFQPDGKATMGKT
jgi:hypothetical protein